MSWAVEELAGLELGDARRHRRLIKLMEDLAAHPTASIPLASGGWAETKAAYRLLDNPAEADFTSQPGIAGLGRLSDEAQPGRYVHPTLVVTPNGVALGVIDAWMWAREPQEGPPVKESTRWLEGYEMVADWAAQVLATRLV